MHSKVQVTCKECGRKPEDIKEYVTEAKENNCTPTDYVQHQEGTYNWHTGKFYCTDCYIKVGMPLGKA